MICYSIFSPPFLAHYVCCQSFCAKVQLLCREKMRPKMYFLRASHKSPQMFLAGYFIGASDRWSWWKKKMVLLEPPPPTLALAHSQLHTQYSLSLQMCHFWPVLKPTDSSRGAKHWLQEQSNIILLVFQTVLFSPQLTLATQYSVAHKKCHTWLILQPIYLAPAAVFTASMVGISM